MVIGAIISGLVGQELVSETSKSIFHSITNILSHEHPVINSILSDLDIPAQIKLIRSIVTEVSENEIHNKDHDDEKSKMTRISSSFKSISRDAAA